MPWNNQGGGWQGGGGQGPWGGRPGGGQQPPDLEELLRRSQEKVKKIFPGGGGGIGGNRKALIAIPLILIAVWLASGFYRVQPDEQGVVLRFGQWIKTTQPGLNWHIPSPIETVLTPKVTRSNRVEIGFRSASEIGRGASSREVANESLMLTGDENIVDINFVLLWLIKDAGQFLFNIRDPEATVKAVAESVMREIIGKTPIAEATTEARGAIEVGAREQIQQILDDYGAGILVTQVQLQKVDPPAEVIDAFRDVQRAQADRERLQNEAEAFANDILPRARGEAERISQEAQAYRQEVVARADGDAQRFIAVYNEYNKARDVTTKRIYLETMEEVLRGMNKVVIDQAANGSGVVPYLPLPELERRARERATGDKVAGDGAESVGEQR
jgi:membrane protease subunit HflK